MPHLPAPLAGHFSRRQQFAHKRVRRLLLAARLLFCSPSRHTGTRIRQHRALHNLTIEITTRIAEKVIDVKNTGNSCDDTEHHIS